MSNLGIIIQARLGSTRLPSKVLKNFGDSTIIEHIFNICKVLGYPVVVATTDNEIDNQLVDFLQNKNIPCFRGNEFNVLKRFIDTAESYNINTIVRVCSDNPFLDLSFLSSLISEYIRNSVDYLSYKFREKPTILSHFGVFSEIVSLNSLKKLISTFPDNHEYLEHVTLGIYSNPNLFNVKLINLPYSINSFENIRLTVDTIQDYNNMVYIYNNYYHINKDFIDLANEILNDEYIINLMKINIVNNPK